jgi:NADP-dependent 3-hydroxy acid dehydrogenase YdfG
MSILTDKIALVTGASSGIGEATAKALAEAGVKVALAARRTDRLKKLAAEISPDGSRALVCPTDVTCRAQVAAAVHAVQTQWGAIDILVNNAGIMPLSFIRNLHVDEWDRMVEVNIRGVLNCTAAVLPQMLKRKAGHIVNVSSLAGRRVFAAGSVYCGTKYFVNAFSEGLRLELSPKDNIRVTIIEPALTRSELTQTITDRQVAESFANLQKLKILNSEDIASAIVYAVSQPPHVNVNEVLIRPTAQES